VGINAERCFVADAARRLLRSGRKNQARHANAQIISGTASWVPLRKPCQNGKAFLMRCRGQGKILFCAADALTQMDQLGQVARINNIRQRASEIVNAEMIYA